MDVEITLSDGTKHWWYDLSDDTVDQITELIGMPHSSTV